MVSIQVALQLVLLEHTLAPLQPRGLLSPLGPRHCPGTPLWPLITSRSGYPKPSVMTQIRLARYHGEDTRHQQLLHWLPPLPPEFLRLSVPTPSSSFWAAI